MTEYTVRVESRFKNARLYRAIEERSVCLHHSANSAALHEIGPIKAFCDLHGLKLDIVYQLINLKLSPRYVASPKRSPQKRDGHYRPICLQLASLLDADVDWLFPAELYAASLKSVVGHLSTSQFISLAAAKSDPALMVAPSPDDAVMHEQLFGAIHTSLSTLTPREQQVIRLRFGLEADEEEHTLEQAAQTLHVSRERIRQIENRALRKLRHPTRSRRLKPYIDAL